MASITLHEILIDEDVNDSRIKINENTDTVEDAVNALLNLLDTDTSVMSGIKSITVDADAGGSSIVTLTNNGSTDLNGNIDVAGTAVVAGNTTINANLTVNTGSVTVNENLTVIKKTKMSGTIIETQAGMASIIDVSALTTDQSVSGLSFLPLSWASYDPVDTAQDTQEITLGAGTDAGQVIELFVTAVSTSSPEATMTLKNTRFDTNFVPSDIVFSDAGEYLKLVWNGTYWHVINAHPRIYTNNPTLK